MISPKRFFAFVFLTAVGALVFGLALVQQKNLELNAGRVEKWMREQWVFAALELEEGAGPAEFGRLLEKTGLEAALVDKAGRTLFDSGGPAPDEAYQDLEEIRSAFLGVPSLVRRRSRAAEPRFLLHREREPRVKFELAAEHFQHHGTARAVVNRPPLDAAIAERDEVRVEIHGVADADGLQRLLP